MAKPGKEQLRFGVRNGNSLKAKFSLPSTPREVVEPESIYWVDRMVTMTDIVGSFYENKAGSRDVFSGAMVVGSAVDYMATASKIIYGEREWYCSDPKENPKMILEKILPYSYPTGGNYYQLLDLLSRHRSSFIEARQGHRPFEREEIKEKLYPIWDEIASKFKIQDLYHQSTMMNENGILLPSGRTASSEDVGKIARDIIEKRFDALVVNDPDYEIISQPGFFIRVGIDGKIFHVYVRPDYIERRKEYQKTTGQREIIAKKKGLNVAKLIVGDFKDSDRGMFADQQSPIRRTVRQVQLFHNLIARKFDPNLLRKKIRVAGKSIKDWRAFVITKDTPDSFPPDQVETTFICLDEEGKDMVLNMPELTPEERALAIQDLKDFLQKAA